MALGIVAATRNNMLNQIKAAIDNGGAAGTIKVYDGTRPATGGTATNLLVTLTFSYPSAPSASGGVLTFSAITNGTAVYTSTATWARIQDSTSAFVADCSVTASGGGGDLQLNTVSISTGLTVSVTSATITAGNP
jgi:phage-related protein